MYRATPDPRAVAWRFVALACVAAVAAVVLFVSEAGAQQALCDYTAETSAANIATLEVIMGDPADNCEGYSVAFSDLVTAIETAGIDATGAPFDGLTTGSNTTATMTLGTGGSIVVNGGQLSNVGTTSKVNFYNTAGASLPMQLAANSNGTLDIYRNGTQVWSVSASSLSSTTGDPAAALLGDASACVAHSFASDCLTGLHRDATTGGFSLRDDNTQLILGTISGDDRVIVNGCANFGARSTAPAVTTPAECDVYTDTDDGSGNAAFCVYLDGAWTVAAGAGACA